MYEEAHYEDGGSKLVRVAVVNEFGFAVGAVEHYGPIGGLVEVNSRVVIVDDDRFNEALAKAFGRLNEV